MSRQRWNLPEKEAFIRAWLGKRQHDRARKRVYAPTQQCTSTLIARVANCIVPWTAAEYPGRQRWLSGALAVESNTAKRMYAPSARVAPGHYARLAALLRAHITSCQAILAELDHAAATGGTRRPRPPKSPPSNLS